MTTFTSPKQIDWSAQPLGEVLDRIVAERLGVTPKAVQAARKARGIARCRDHSQRAVRTDSLMITLDGVTRPLREWASLRGIKFTTAYERLRRGWSVERALGPARHYSQGLKHDGTTKAITRWAAEHGIIPTTLKGRLASGWPVHRALTEPTHPVNRTPGGGTARSSP